MHNNLVGRKKDCQNCTNYSVHAFKSEYKLNRLNVKMNSKLYDFKGE